MSEKIKENKKQRDFGLDVVRILALCLLLWLHFLLRNGFYYKAVNTIPMTLAASGRCLFMCCIPIFLMLTGYLKINKPWKKGYYRSLGPMLIAWAMISVLCLWYKIEVKGTEKTAYEWLVEFLNFDLANYSWYIEMYIGLLILSPFVNLAWKNAGSSKRQLLMLLSFVVLTLLPATVNGFAADGENKLNLIPNYWSNIYFLTYYLIGAAIRTWKPKVNHLLSILFALLTALLFGILDRITGGAADRFSAGYTISYNHMGTAAMSVFLFLGCYDLECSSDIIRRMAAAISTVTLEMYLISCIFDQQIYPYQAGQYDPSEYWWRGLLSTGLVFTASYFSGRVIHIISIFLYNMWETGIRKIHMVITSSPGSAK